MSESHDGKRQMSPDIPLLPTLASVPIQLGILLSYDEDGKPDEIRRLASASAFVVEANEGQKFLITARHCVTGKDNDTSQFLNPKLPCKPDHIVIMAPRTKMTSEQFSAAAAEDSYIALIMPLYDNLGSPVWYEHGTPHVDVVAIALPEPAADAERPWSFHAYPTSAWGDHKMMDPSRPVVQAGDFISVVGHPLGLSAHVALPIWTHATIASDMAIGSGVIGTFLIDASTTTGNSGSAVVYYRHGGTAWMRQRSRPPYQQIVNEPVVLLLGIYSARLKNPHSEKETTIGRVWKQELLEAVLPMPHGSGNTRRPMPPASSGKAERVPSVDETEPMNLCETVSFMADAVVLPNSAPLKMAPARGFGKVAKGSRPR